MLLNGPLKETTAVRTFSTPLARFEVESLPIGNGLARIAPQGRFEYAQLMIVDGNSHIPHGKKFNCFLKAVLIVKRVDPQLLNVAGRISSVFETHQCNMLDKCKVSINVFHNFGQSWNRKFVQYNSDGRGKSK